MITAKTEKSCMCTPEGWRPVCRPALPPPPHVWSRSSSRTGCPHTLHVLDSARS